MNTIKLEKRRLKIGFFGTPELAAIVLKALIEADEDDICLVVCQPDKPQGRKRKIIPPPVKVLALENDIEVIQPTKMRDGSLAALLRDAELDLAIVIAYGRILTKDTLESVRGGFWNIHTSILPKHRGASPIHHALLDGDRETGVTLMKMTEGCDEGPILSISRTPIDDRETLSSLSEKLVALGCKLVLQSLRNVKDSGLTIVEQEHDKASHARLLLKSDGQLDFRNQSVALDRQVRALNPWPGSFVRLEDGAALKVLEAHAVHNDVSGELGSIVSLDEDLRIQTSQGCIALTKVQAPGKKPMSSLDYLRGAGRHWKLGEQLGVFPCS